MVPKLNKEYAQPKNQLSFMNNELALMNDSHLLFVERKQQKQAINFRKTFEWNLFEQSSSTDKEWKT